MAKKEPIFLTFEEDPTLREIPIIVSGREVSDDYIASAIAVARAKIHKSIAMDDIEQVIFVVDKIVNFVSFKKN